MSSESVRFRKRDIHQHDEADPAASDATRPAPEPDGCEAGADGSGFGRLWRDGDKVMYQAESGEPAPVRILWARPLSRRGGPVSIMAAGKKREVAYLPGLDVLSGESRRIAGEELAGGMILPRIVAIHSVRPRFGNYYWDVGTDRGRRVFLLASPENNSLNPLPDSLVIRDTSGNCYEINPVSSLDRKSLIELDRVY